MIMMLYEIAFLLETTWNASESPEPRARARTAGRLRLAAPATRFHVCHTMVSHACSRGAFQQLIPETQTQIS
jgi:hypothetical protein